MERKRQITYSVDSRKRIATASTRPPPSDQTSAARAQDRVDTETQSSFSPSSPAPDEGRSRHRISEKEVQSLAPDSIMTTTLPISIKRQDMAKRNARIPRADYAELLKSGFLFVAATAYAEEIADRHSVATNMSEAEFRVAAVHILASIPSAILELIVGGNICSASRSDDDLRHLLHSPDSLWHIRASDKNAPGVYVRNLVDDQGNAPTPNQYLRVTARLRDYVSGNPDTFQAAADLDNVKGTTKASKKDIQNGRYRYLAGLEYRVMQILTFCTALEDRIRLLPRDDLDKPSPRPCTYVGYSISVSRRLQQHDTAETNWFHHMVQAAFRLEVEEQLFSFESYAVCFLEENEERVAEVLISTITDSVVETGGGFGVYQAGIQTTSSLLSHLPIADRPKVWKACEQWRRDNTQYEQNLEDETTRLQQYNDDPPNALANTEVDDLRKQIANSRKEVEELERKLQEEDDNIERIFQQIEQLDRDDPDSDSDTGARKAIRAAVGVLRRNLRS